MMQSARLFLLASLGGVTAALPATAESYCVACYSPDAVYRCVIADAPSSAPPDPRNQVQCIKQLAKSGGHARCSVERFTSAGCSGPERIISPAVSALPVAPPAQAEVPSREPVPPGAVSGSAAPDGNGVNEPPRTVEELAKSTVETTKRGLDGVSGSVKTTTEKAGEQIEGVGSSIGQAAKKGWHCLSSLFSDC
jgi:hypothetical protein